MKIAVSGYAGGGKTYLSDYISEKKNISVLHMANDDWIIDGYYKYLFYDERFEEADMIILLLLPRMTCFCRVVKRARERRKDGYKNDLNPWFVKFTLFGCRNKERRQSYAEIIKNYKDKTVVLKTKRQVNEFMKKYR